MDQRIRTEQRTRSKCRQVSTVLAKLSGVCVNNYSEPKPHFGFWLSTTRSGFVFWVHDSGRVFLSRSRTDYSNANNSVVASVGSPSRHHFERTQL